MSTHLFGMKMMSIVDANRGISEKTRSGIQRLESEVQEASEVKVGTASRYERFIPAGVDAKQAGNALQVSSATNANRFVLYYRDEKDTGLYRIESDQRVPTLVMANIANAEVFSFESHSGEVLTNISNTRIVRTHLSLSKVENSGTPVGTGKAFDNYEINSRIAFTSW